MLHAVLIALGLASAPAMPDPRLTPGAVATTDRATICAPGYDKAHRVWHDKRGTLAKYGIPWSERAQLARKMGRCAPEGPARMVRLPTGLRRPRQRRRGAIVVSR